MADRTPELTHAERAEFVRELLLTGHLIDRSGMPHLISRLGREGMAEVAIDEWMAASPIYTPRIRELLGFPGDTVEVIFKAMQFDIGAPPEFMDFRYTVHDDHHGEFHLAHCGALMDVEPMGELYVQTMCHDIEDPTFDATAVATNPRARMRPIHRPPRVPADRDPHCAWEVFIDPALDPLPFPPQAERMGGSEAARLPLTVRPDHLPDDDGERVYDGPVDSDLRAERFSSATLAALADEIALQHHLLSRGFLLSVADRVGEEAVAIGLAQLTGIAGLTAKRLGRAFGSTADPDGVAAMLRLHPMLRPHAYVPARVERSGEDVRVSISDGPALREEDGLTWPSLLVGDDAPLRAAAEAILPTARVERVDDPTAVAAWIIRDNPDAVVPDQHETVTLVEFSTGADFRFGRRTDSPTR